MQPLEHSYFTTSHLKQSTQFDAWRDSIGVMFDVRLDTASEDSGFHALTDSYLLDSMMLTRCAAGRQKFDRKSVRIARDGIDHYMIQLFVKGRVEMRVAGKQMVGPTRSIVGFDLGDTLDSVNTDFDLLSAFIPRRELAPLLRYPDNVPGTMVDTAQGEGKLLADFMEAVFRAAPTLSRDAGPSVASSLIHMVAAALNRSLEVLEDAPTALMQSHLIRARQFIEDNLDREDLTPALLAQHLGVSRATLYRTFESHGGVAQFIRRRRLNRALKHLVAPPPGILKQRISDIAFSTGFNDSAQFSRLFRNAFGISPSEARHQADRMSSADQRRTFLNDGISDTLYEQWIARVL
ncbi:MAG: helix-turn-helix domain-containing protein [Magnetococcales bacterium]|nr:helix-turn-helix domain-containing protein [Magnetococcales bacterium]